MLKCNNENPEGQYQQQQCTHYLLRVICTLPCFYTLAHYRKVNLSAAVSLGHSRANSTRRHVLPFLGALDHQLLVGGHKLELGCMFSYTLQSLPHWSHDDQSIHWSSSGLATQQLQQSRGFQSKKSFACMSLLLLKTHLPLEMMSGVHKSSPCFTG